MNLNNFLDFVAFVLIFKWAFLGAYAWLRYGFDGVLFIWSKDFSASLRAWQQLERTRKRKEEKLAIARAGETETIQRVAR